MNSKESQTTRTSSLYDIDAEKALLGCILLDGKVSEEAMRLNTASFYSNAHKVIFVAMLSLANKGDPCTGISIANELKAAESFDIAGGAAYISELSYTVASTQNIGYYIKRLLELSSRREVLRLANEMQQNAIDESITGDELLENATEKILHLKQEKDNKLKCERTFAEMINASVNVPDGYKSTVFRSLLFPCETISFIGARTSRGKTTAMVSIAIDALTQANSRPVLFVTLEEQDYQILRRLIMCHAYKMADSETRFRLATEPNPFYDIALPNDGEELDPRQAYKAWIWSALNDGRGRGVSKEFSTAISTSAAFIADAISQKRLAIYRGQGAAMGGIAARIMAAPKGALVLFDYIQRAPGEEDTDILRIRHANEMLLTAAIRASAIIIAGAQFNRLGTQEDEKSDDVFSEKSFKDCGDIEQDAHIAVGLGWNKNTSETGERKRFSQILKNREGGNVGKRHDLIFNGAYSYMAESAEQKETKQAGKSSKSQKEYYAVEYPL